MALPTKSSDVLTVISASGFEHLRDLLEFIFESVQSVTKPQDLLFTDVSPALGSLVFDALGEKIVSRYVRCEAPRYSTLIQTYSSTRKSWNSKTCKLRIRIMPTEIHDCHQSWMLAVVKEWFFNGHTTQDECAILDSRVGTSKSSYSLSASQTRLTKLNT